MGSAQEWSHTTRPCGQLVLRYCTNSLKRNFSGKLSEMGSARDFPWLCCAGWYVHDKLPALSPAQGLPSSSSTAPGSRGWDCLPSHHCDWRQPKGPVNWGTAYMIILINIPFLSVNEFAKVWTPTIPTCLVLLFLPFSSTIAKRPLSVLLLTLAHTLYSGLEPDGMLENLLMLPSTDTVGTQPKRAC